MTQLADHPPSPEDSSAASAHPRLFWSAGEVDAFRAKAQDPELAAVRDGVLARCERYVDPQHDTWIDCTQNRRALVGTGAACGHTWQKLPDLVLASILTDDARWPDLLLRVLRVFTQDDSPMEATIFGGTFDSFLEQSVIDGETQRNLASQCGMIPLMLDLLWDRLDPPDREAAVAYLDREIVAPYLSFALDETRDAAYQQHIGVNLGWWDFYSWVWSLAVIYDPANPRHVDGMDAALRRIRLGVHLASDESGIIGEGAGYASIELFAWSSAAEVLRRQGIADLWATDRRFAEVMRARVYYQLPSDHGLLDHGDTARAEGCQGGLVGVLLLQSVRTGDLAYQATARRYLDVAGLTIAPATMHGPLGSLGHWLWSTPANDEEMAADLQKWPLTRTGGHFGLHFIRDGWADDDLYVAFFAAGRDPGTYIHQHCDAGHFALAAHGELYCAGRGYGHSPAKYHNILQPIGFGNTDMTANSQTWRGGHTIAAAHAEHSNVVSMDLAAQWQCCWYQRYAIVLRLPGTDPYVLILDHCNPANDWAEFDWQFQVQDGYRAAIDSDEKRATVTGRRHRLELAWTTLGMDEYPKPQELDVRMQQYRHVYADSRPNPKRDKIRYDCLTAHLAGYSGVLLSALVPRRAGSPSVGITRFYAVRQMGLVIDHGDMVDTIVANPQTRRIHCAGIDAEASAVVVRRDHEGCLIAVVATDAYHVKVDGHEVLAPRGEWHALVEFIDFSTDPKG